MRCLTLLAIMATTAQAELLHTIGFRHSGGLPEPAQLHVLDSSFRGLPDSVLSYPVAESLTIGGRGIYSLDDAPLFFEITPANAEQFDMDWDAWESALLAKYTPNPFAVERPRDPWLRWDVWIDNRVIGVRTHQQDWDQVHPDSWDLERIEAEFTNSTMLARLYGQRTFKVPEPGIMAFVLFLIVCHGLGRQKRAI